MTGDDLIVLAVVILAGLLRGITGFGGAMLMTPPLSLLLDPVTAVVNSLALEAAAGLVVSRKAWARIDKPMLAQLTLPAFVTAPLGSLLLVSLDPVLARRMIALVVILLSAMLLAGARYRGPQRPSITLSLGGVAGVLLGATGIGAPPVILYMLAGSEPPEVARANLTIFITVISVIGLIVLIASGTAAWQFARWVPLLAAPYLAATWTGGALSGRMSNIAIRRLSLGFMLAAGFAALVL